MNDEQKPEGTWIGVGLSAVMLAGSFLACIITGFAASEMREDEAVMLSVDRRPHEAPHVSRRGYMTDVRRSGRSGEPVGLHGGLETGAKIHRMPSAPARLNLRPRRRDEPLTENVEGSYWLRRHPLLGGRGETATGRNELRFSATV